MKNPIDVNSTWPHEASTAGQVAEVNRVDFSIITSLFNCLNLTRGYLASLERSMPENVSYEVILVDDCSTDGTREFLKELPSERYRIHLNAQKKNYAVNNNLGAKMACGRFIVLLNNDVVLQPGWLEPLWAIYEQEPKVGAVGNVHLNATTGRIDHAGVSFLPSGMPFHCYKGRKRLNKKGYEDKLAVSAACLLVEKKVFQELGGFDEAYINGSEDTDFCIRLRLAGWSIFIAYESRILHYVSSSPGRLDHYEANVTRLTEKWRGVTAEWAKERWVQDYFNRYLHCFWRVNPKLALMALAKLFCIS